MHGDVLVKIVQRLAVMSCRFLSSPRVQLPDTKLLRRQRWHRPVDLGKILTREPVRLQGRLQQRERRLIDKISRRFASHILILVPFLALSDGDAGPRRAFPSQDACGS